MMDENNFKSLAFRLTDQIESLTQLVATLQASINQLLATDNQRNLKDLNLSNQVILAQPAPIRLFSSSPPLIQQEDSIMSYLSASNHDAPSDQDYHLKNVFRSDLVDTAPMLGAYEDLDYMQICETHPTCTIDYDNDRFHLISPLQPPAISKPRKIIKKANNGPLKILIVEDDPLCQQLICHIIKSLNFGQFEVVEDGVEAVINMSTQNFDLILMDMHLPHLDGLQATQNIRKFNRRIPIISMTAKVGAEDVKKYFEGGIDDVLPKPFDKESVLRIIEQFFKLSISDE